MKLALDYDDTFTADPEFWREMIMLARKYGHKTYIVTLRCPVQDVIPEAEDLLYNHEVDIIYCNGEAKKEVTDKLGHVFDIWIDDKPEVIHSGSSYTVDQLLEWRASR